MQISTHIKSFRRFKLKLATLVTLIFLLFFLCYSALPPSVTTTPPNITFGSQFGSGGSSGREGSGANARWGIEEEQ